MADTDSNDVALLYGVGDGTFRLGPALAVGAEPVALVAADLNGDGRLDLVTANRTSGDLTFLWNPGDGTFRASTWRGAPSRLGARSPPTSTATGMLDLAVADQAGNRILILWGSAAAGSHPAVVRGRAGARRPGRGDLDGSGDGSPT